MNLTTEIQEGLKDVHIECGSVESFDRVCINLSNKIKTGNVFEMGYIAGQGDLIGIIKELIAHSTSPGYIEYDLVKRAEDLIAKVEGK